MNIVILRILEYYVVNFIKGWKKKYGFKNINILVEYIFDCF